MPNKSAAPDVPSRDVDPVAAAVIDDALKVRVSHPAVPTMDILDLVLQGRRTRPLNFGAISPVSPFGLLVVEAFDRGMPVSDWIGFYRYPDPRVIAALDDIWRKECGRHSPLTLGLHRARGLQAGLPPWPVLKTRRKQLRDPAFFLDFIA